MNVIRIWVLALLSMIFLSACEAKKTQDDVQKDESKASAAAEILPYLKIQEQPAKIALPFCESKECLDLHIQTIQTADPWLNTWIERQQAMVVQDQIGLKQAMHLQQAVDAYIRASDIAQESEGADAFRLDMYTRIPTQRNQYVLLQIGLNSQQKGIEISERNYFYVADRKASKAVALLDIIEPSQQVTMDKIVQQAYQKWLLEQELQVQAKAPKKLYWGQADWFFDQEGVGLHYRSDEIVKDSRQLDVYLTKQQTQQVLKLTVYEHMF